MTDVDVLKYEEQRNALEALQEEFARYRHLDLFHDLLWFEEPLSSGGWNMFLEKNRERFLERDGHSWEEWSLFDDSIRAGRFHGNSSKKAIKQFWQLTNRGFVTLKELRKMIESGHGVPSGVRLQLPMATDEGNTSAPTWGWLELIHECGRMWPTTGLERDGSFWGIDNQLSSDESWALIERRSESPNDGSSVQDHPSCDSLIQNVFEASSEAIQLWLYPDSLVSTDAWDGDVPPIYIPLHPRPRLTQVKEPKSAITQDGPDEAMPLWNEKTRELWFGDILLRKYGKEPAERQTNILQGFQQQVWANPLNDPLEYGLDDLPPKIRQDTVRHLNNSLADKTLIHFGLDGTGRFLWNRGPKPNRSNTQQK